MRLSIRESASDAVQPQVKSRASPSVVRRFVSHRLAVLGLSILFVLIALAIFAPALAPYDPIKRDFSARLAPPSAKHWLGTDALGRDVLTRILYGGRISLYVGLFSVVLSLLIGVPVGLIAG